MKKLLSIVLAAILVLTAMSVFASCSNSNENEKTSKDNEKVKVIDIPLSEESYAFAVSKTDTDLLKKVNDFLKKIKDNGTFDTICNKYFGNGTPTKYKSAKKDDSKDQLVVATSTGFEPFEMVENGEFYGIDLEIAGLLAKELGKELVIEDMRFASVVTSVQTGKCDIGMAGLTITPAREEIVTFSDSYYSANQVLIVKSSDNKFDACTKQEDVVKILDKLTKETKIGCQAGTTGEKYLEGDKYNADGSINEEGYGFEGVPCTKKAYDYAALAVTAMLNGEINYVIIDNAPANAIAKKINE